MHSERPPDNPATTQGVYRGAMSSYLKDMSRHDMLTPLDEQAVQERLISARAELEQVLSLLGIMVEVDKWVGGNREIPPEVAKKADPKLLERLAVAQSSFDAVVDVYWRHNLRMVVSIVKKYGGRGMLELEDLIQEGNLALRKAIQKYRPETGNKLITYATGWIRSRVIRYIQNFGYTVGQPSHVHTLLNRCRRIEARLRQEYGYVDEEILARKLEISQEKLAMLREFAQAQLPLSVDATVDPEGEGVAYVENLFDPHIPLPDAEVIARQMEEFLQEKFSTLKPREQQILQKRLMDQMTLQEIGDEMGMTRERVRQIQESLSGKMKVLLQRQEGDYRKLL